MNWQEICDDPSLQDLPYKIETNEYGQIVMSPASNQHGRNQTRIGILLSQHADAGEIISECSVETRAGVKVADVAWLSQEFFHKRGYETPYPVAPEVCVEVISPSNSRKEISEKIALYLEAGAREVWVCDAVGNIDFHSSAGEISASTLFPGFPAKI